MMCPIKLPKKNNEPISEIKTEEVLQKKHHTVKQINTIRILHEIVAIYDSLLNKYNAEPTADNKQALDDHSTYLRNVSQLAKHTQKYIDENNLQDTLLAPSKIRKLITEEIASGALIKIDGLIRYPKTNPYADVSSTGNIIPIILPQEYINDLKTTLTKELINDSVRILVPCNNMIIIVETGNHTNNINEDLNIKIFQTIMLFAPKYGLGLPKAFDTTVAKYILS